MKKTFACGHKGKGSYCHLCQQIDNARALAQEKKVNRGKVQEKKNAEADPIDLSSIRHRPVTLARARKIIAAITAGEDYRQFGGKLLAAQRNEVLSIRVDHYYRLLFSVETMSPIMLLHHEDYNNIAAAGIRRASLVKLTPR